MIPAAWPRDESLAERLLLIRGERWEDRIVADLATILGKGDLEGTPVQRLKLTNKDGDVTTIYLDADSGLELKEESTRKMRGQATDIEATFGNFKQVGGLTMPYTIENKVKGAPGSQVITSA